jgi:16S rRNA processing protein RimM
VFVECNKHLVPFFIESSSKKFLRVRFEDVSNEEEADAILGNNLYLPQKNVAKLSGNKFYFHEVIGFEVEDIRYVGEIQSVNDTTAQPLLVLKGEIEILIPMIDHFLSKLTVRIKVIMDFT